MNVHRLRSAAIVMMLALVATLLAATPSFAASDCPSDLTEFKINNSPSEGTHSDGTLSVTISNVDSDSFDWSSNIEVESVMVKGGPVLQENPGGRGGTARTADNPNNDQRYGISHVSFCYTTSKTSGGGGDDDEDCPENGKGNGNGNGKDDEDCPEDDDDCPEDSKGKGKGMDDEDCEDDDDDRDDDRDDEDDEDDEDEDDEDLDDVEGGVVSRPSKPQPDAERPREQPETRVRGLRVRGRTGPAVAAAPEVRGEHRRDQQEAEVLPRTGMTVLPWLVLGLGLVAAGTLFWRRRHQS